ncbi:MAG TPA: GAF domain-containing sensor histidine kinase [Candidatus Limnocylindrales bacterium]|nr:GAF domain-containing sensor histidine kinase [Candidatus Limnocylindrales bacterium]
MRSDEALYALDRATRAIAGELDIERVLQQMVDSVRDLVGAKYAALGIIGPDGHLQRFITSGIAAEHRMLIGALPSGYGLLGTLIRDGVSLRIPDISRHPDSYGFPPEHPEMHSFLGVPVHVGSETVGNFYLTEKRDAPEFSADDQELVEMFARHAGIAIQNARLHHDVQQLAVVDERLRISRDLHDGIIQSIYAVSLSLEDVLDLIESDRAEAEARVDRAIDRLHTAIGDIRGFITGLGVGLGDGAGLRHALEAMAADLLGGTGIDVSVDVRGASELDARLPPEANHELLQIAREAVSNVARHSGARRASLSLVVADDEAVLRIEDDGAGFDPEEKRGSGHFGLANLRDRAAGVGGTLDIQSEPANGTRIIVRLPLAPTESPT